MSTGERWDAVVVGAGVGGLVCAGYLAVTGHRVLVLEHHDVAGGNSHVFRRRRAYEFDVGVHYLGDCGPDGLLTAVLAGLGLAGRVRFRELDPDGFDEIRVPGAHVRVPADWRSYRDRLAAVLPGELPGLDTFLDVARAVATAQRAMLLAPDPAGLRAEAGTVLAWSRRTLTDLFDHCGLSARARTLLAAQSPNYGLPPNRTPVTAHATVIDHYLRGAYYPVGGGQEIAAALVEAIEAHGGAVRTRSRVRRILVEGGAVTGVALADGRTVHTGLVVSNADYVRTVLELVGPEHFAPGIVNRARTATPALPLVSVYVALDRELDRADAANLWWYPHDDIERAFRRLDLGDLDEIPYLLASFGSLKEPRACPPGHANFQLMTTWPADRELWGAAGARYRRDPAYRRAKARVTDAVLAAAEAALGPFRAHLTHVETATPLTQERYTLSTGGTPFGLAHWGTPSDRPGVRTGIGGLYVAGQSTKQGNGITGVAVSGITAASAITGRPLLAEVHGGAVLGDPGRLPARTADWDALAVSRGRERRGARGLARLDSVSSSGSAVSRS